MPPSPSTEKHKKRVLRLHLLSFEQNLQGGDAGLELALSQLQKILYFGDLSLLTEDLMSKPHLYEYLFSVVGDGAATLLRENILNEATLDLKNYLESPCAVALFRFSELLGTLTYTAANSKPPPLEKDLHFVQFSRDILNSLSTANFSLQAGGFAENQDNEDEDFLKQPKKRRSQKQNSQGKRLRKVVLSFNPMPFEALGKKTPTTEEEANSLARELMVEQKAVLERFFEYLRKPSFSSLIHGKYSPQATVSEVEAPDQAVEEFPAFPTIQPLRASLYFDSVKGFGDWRIFISTRAEKALREHKKFSKTFDIIVKKIKELSHGHFSDDNQKRLKGPSGDIPIFEAKLTGDLRLVYQVDCVSDYGTDIESQVLRIFGIFTHAQMDGRMWESLSARLARRGPEYKRRVTFRARPLVPGDKVYPPQTWPSLCKDESKNDNSAYSIIRSDDLEEIHQWIVWVTCHFQILCVYLTRQIDWRNTLGFHSVNQGILANAGTYPIFTVSPYEKEIIENTSSCYVLGRSGTGKTTTMLFKIFGIERSALTTRQDGIRPSKPRQLFVTQSRVLADRVEEYYKNLTKFLDIASKDSKELAELFIRNQEHALEEQREELVDRDEEDDWRSDLPKRFSDLQDKHFPLFLTFDKLCKLLEADLGLQLTHRKYTKEHKRAESRFTLDSITEGQDALDASPSDDEEVDHSEPSTTLPPVSIDDATPVSSLLIEPDVFRLSYWPHFPQHLTKRLDPALVFSEFLGVIKGSEQTLYSKERFLSREDYISYSCRGQATFANQRERIYDLFESYQKRKADRGDYDAADRSHMILALLKTEELNLVDYLYVDEAQDNLLIDTLLLRSMCKHSQGLFWAGDTAQTIAIGSSFRFNELKALMHRIEEQRFKGKQLKYRAQPKLFQLTMNYRSHGGIVNCADSIVQLITKYWPDSIDLLEREQGVVDGMHPVFLTGWDENTLRLEDFLFGEGENMVEFGAQQCILVRNDAARDELRKNVGQIGLILTLYESKGLEFDDVLLYNFFKDSPSDLSQWRMVLNAVPEVEASSTPRFDEVRHASISSELKSFYVAITRARKNLWIADCSEKSLPMKTLLLSKGLVDLRTPETMPALAVTSSEEQWDKAGRLFFRHRRYVQASHCFERAGHTAEKGIADAYELRKNARAIPIRSGNRYQRISAFQSAGNMFSHCAGSSADSRNAYYRIAAECFMSAEDHRSAAQAYQRAEMFSLAAKQYRIAGMFDEAVDLIRKKRELVDSKTYKSIINVSRLYYFKERKIKMASDLFESHEKSLQFTKDYDMDDQRAELLESMGRKTEAADIHFSEGRPRKAIELLFADYKNPQSLAKAADYVLRDLWDTFFFGTENQTGERNSDGAYFLGRAIELGDERLANMKDELQMFKVILQGNKHILRDLVSEFCRLQKNVAAVLLGLDYYFKSFQHTSLDSVQDALLFLEFSSFYAKHLRDFYMDKNACDNVNLRKLFGFRVVSDFEFRILPRSLLCSFAKDSGIDVLRVPRHHLARLIQRGIADDTLGVLRRVTQDNILPFFKSTLFSAPCMQFLVNRRCNRDTCPLEHIQADHVDSTWFNLRLRLLCQQMIFLRSVDFIIPWFDMKTRKRECITHVFELLHPPTHYLGSVANISKNTIPCYGEAMQLLNAWVRDRSFGLGPGRNTFWFLNGVVEVAGLTFHLNPANVGGDFIRRSWFFKSYRPEILLRNGGSYVAQELVDSFAASDDLFVVNGILSLRHIIDKRQGISITYVCYILEFLCGSTILFDSYTRRNMHDTTMPKSWYSFLLRRVTAPRCNLKFTWMLVALLKDLIRQFVQYTEADVCYLMGARSSLTRNICAHRLFRSLCLLGYNLRDYGIKDGIMKYITQLRKESGNASSYSYYSSFLGALSWNDIVRVVRDSTLESNLDEIVQLLQENRVAPNPVRNVRRLTFRSLGDIPLLFNHEPLRNGIFASKVSADAVPFVLKDVHLAAEQGSYLEEGSPKPVADLEAAETIGAVGAGGDDNDNDDDIDNANDTYDQNSEMSEESSNDILVPPTDVAFDLPTERVTMAARTIQGSFRAYLARRNSKPPSALYERRAQYYFVAYLEEASRMIWPRKSLYRLLFLGALPHVALCLDLLRERIVSMKEIAKRQLKEGNHRELEEVGEQFESANDLLSKHDELREKVKYGSEFHEKRDLHELCKVIHGVNGLANQMDVKAVAEDMALAMSMIRARVVPSKKPETKPTLNTGDLWEGMY
ncbi:hypothetical protein M0805_000036 [Coniferiporia weirii]|nr:hypothetical protein M0805_000036 [Coniferiporia weirii]